MEDGQRKLARIGSLDDLVDSSDGLFASEAEIGLCSNTL